MSTAAGWKRHDYKRVCDICGHQFKFSDLKPIGELKWACSDDYKGLTAIQISRHNARARPLVVRPVKHPKPLNSIDTWQYEEGQVFNVVMSGTAIPAEGVAAYVVPYLSDMVIGGGRPLAWTKPALTKINATCVSLLTKQVGSPTSGALATIASTDARFGGYNTGGADYDIGSASRVGLDLAAAYQATGNPRYLAGADRAMMFTRTMQCSDLFTGTKTVYPLGGGGYHTGGLALKINATSSALTDGHQYMDAASTALRLAARMRSIRGGNYQYGNASSGAFTSSTLASIDTIINELTNFCTVGARDSTGVLVNPMAPATPRLIYDAYLSDGSGSATWSQDPTSLASLAFVMNGLWMCQSGLSTVNALYDYAMAFGSNPANRTTSGNQSIVRAANTGTYDPTYTVAASLDFGNNYETTGTTYGWGWAAWCAPIQSSRFPAAFERAKLAASTPRRFDTATIESRYFLPAGVSGLSFQTHRPDLASVTAAAIVGNIYRYGRTHTPQLTGN